MTRNVFRLGVLVAWLAVLAAPANLFAQANGKVVFERDGCIWTMNPDGSNPSQIGNDLAATLCPGNNRDPVWSPDGTKIAFISDTNTTLPSNIYVMNADGTNLVRLVDTFNVLEPAWSPDGTKIAFAANRDGLIGSIWTINVDGTNVQRVTNAPPASDQAPAWSPDGSRIAFWTNEFAIGLHIATVNADGSGRNGFPLDIAHGMNPAWSPDGTRITYDGPNVVTGGNYIWVMNADGTGQTQLTTSAFNDIKPAWAPDGTKIAFERNISGQTHVFVMNADGTGEINITPAAVTNAPDWQRLQTCQLTMTAAYTGGTLNLGFSLANSAPATWGTWLIYSGGVVNLWSVQIPAISPLVSFNLPIPGFPPVGPIGLLTAISTPARGIICGDFKITNAAP